MGQMKIMGSWRKVKKIAKTLSDCSGCKDNRNCDNQLEDRLVGDCIETQYRDTPMWSKVCHVALWRK
jgi:hypothetical protein